MSEFKKGDRVQMGYRMMRSVHGTVVDSKTPYGMVEVLWDDEVEVEDTHVKHWDLTAVTKEQEREADLELARELLEKHGYAVRVWGPEDVHNMLDAYAEGEPDYDTVAHRDEITQFIMNADGWRKTLPEVADPEALLWKIVDITCTAHPEWFPEV